MKKPKPYFFDLKISKETIDAMLNASDDHLEDSVQEMSKLADRTKYPDMKKRYLDQAMAARRVQKWRKNS